MHKDYLDLLSTIGLEEKPARVYLAALESGGGTAAEISKKAGIERVNTYYILEQLVHRGLVAMSEKKRVTIFVAQSPKKLEKLAQERLHEIQKVLPELLSIENTSAVKPKVRFYEGGEGIKQLFEETLTLPKGAEMLAYSTASAIHEYLNDYVPYYLEQRVKKGITQRAIVEDSMRARVHKHADKAELRETIIVPAGRFPFKNEINIFGDKIMIASYRDMMGVIIESKDIAETQRSIFELAWAGAKQFEVKSAKLDS